MQNLYQYFMHSFAFIGIIFELVYYFNKYCYLILNLRSTIIVKTINSVMFVI